MKSKYVYYGSPVLIQNIGSVKSYLSICTDEQFESQRCGMLTDIFFYDSIDDAFEYGRWIILPRIIKM